MPDLAVRRRVPELMDDPALDPREHARALSGLRRINALSRSDAILWPDLRDLARRLGRPMRVLDVATGSGDVPTRLARRFERSGLAVEMAGCDISPVAIDGARSANPAIRWFVHDIIQSPLPERFDVVTCSLFLHHLDDPDALTLMRHMAGAADHLVLINDLRRCRTGWWAAYIGTRILSRSPVVHFDGPVSVSGAYTADEAKRLAQQAGLDGVSVQHRWPWRFLLKSAHAPDAGR